MLLTEIVTAIIVC